MRGLVVIMAVLANLALAGGPASAEEKCPKGNAPIFEEDLKAAPDCASAHALHEACAWGSSGDAGLTGVVVEKCEAVFLNLLDAKQKRNYQARVKRCAEKASREQGTAAISEGAMCEEEVAAAFAKDADAAGRIKATPLGPVKASFDCRKAETPLENLICSTTDIGASDIDLSKVYRQAFNGATPTVRKVLADSEKGWLKHVSTTCLGPNSGGTDLEKLCTQNAFDARITQLPLCMAKGGDERTTCLNSFDRP